MRFGLQKYVKTALMAATSYFGDSPLFLMDYLLRLLRVTVLLSVWRTLFAHNGTQSGMTLPTLLTYTLIAEAFAEQLEAYTDVTDSFWDGSITTRFNRPLGIFAQFTAEAAGRWAFGLIAFSLPLLAVGAMTGIRVSPVNLWAGLLFGISLALAVRVGLALDFLFTSFAVSLQFPPFAISRIKTAIASLLSGMFVPLALLPWNLGRVFEWLPFASMASAPLRIYTGTGNPARLLALQLAWAIVLWPLAAWMWRKNREKMVAYGG